MKWLPDPTSVLQVYNYVLASFVWRNFIYFLNNRDSFATFNITGKCRILNLEQVYLCVCAGSQLDKPSSELSYSLTQI